MWFNPIAWSCEVEGHGEYTICIDYNENNEQKFRAEWYPEEGTENDFLEYFYFFVEETLLDTFKEAREWCKEHFKKVKENNVSQQSSFELQGIVDSTLESP